MRGILTTPGSTVKDSLHIARYAARLESYAVWSVEQPVEDFADFIRRVREAARLSTRDVAKASGGLISHGYVSQLENRSVLGPGVSPRRLLGLARGLHLSVEEVFAAARGHKMAKMAEKHIRLIGFFDRLPDDRQNEALDLMEVLSRRYGENANEQHK